MQNVAVRALLSGGDAAAGSSGGLSGLLDIGLQITDFAFDLFDLMIAHPLLSVFIAAGVVSIAAGLFGRFAGVAKTVG